MIHLISGPRNISTSLMYSFNNREDCLGIDEPFYGHYLRHTGLNHPGRETILDKMETNEEVIVKQLESIDSKQEFLFIKNMAAHLGQLKSKFYRKARNLFLIRNTDAVIHSFAKVVPDVSIEDIGIQQEYEIYQELLAQGSKPPIIDSNELLKDPEKILRATCKQLDIPFDKQMLAWEAGPKEIDGIWATDWYTNTHKSTGFSKHISSKMESLAPHLQAVAEEANYYYQELFKHSIKA